MSLANADCFCCGGNVEGVDGEGDGDGCVTCVDEGGALRLCAKSFVEDSAAKTMPVTVIAVIIARHMRLKRKISLRSILFLA